MTWAPARRSFAGALAGLALLFAVAPTSPAATNWVLTSNNSFASVPYSSSGQTNGFSWNISCTTNNLSLYADSSNVLAYGQAQVLNNVMVTTNTSGYFIKYANLEAEARGVYQWSGVPGMSTAVTVQQYFGLAIGGTAMGAMTIRTNATAQFRGSATGTGFSALDGTACDTNNPSISAQVQGYCYQNAQTRTNGAYGSYTYSGGATVSGTPYSYYGIANGDLYYDVSLAIYMSCNLQYRVPAGTSRFEPVFNTKIQTYGELNGSNHGANAGGAEEWMYSNFDVEFNLYF